MTRAIIRTHKRRTKKGTILVKRHTRKIPQKFRDPKYLEKLKRGKPKLPLIKRPQVTKTTFIQDPKTGLLQGRKTVQGQGDQTGILFDRSAGRIFGRLPKKKLKK